MDSGLWLVFAMAVHVVCRTGAQTSTTASSSTKTSSSLVPIPATTTAAAATSAATTALLLSASTNTSPLTITNTHTSPFTTHTSPPITTTDYTTHPPITTTNTSTPPITPTDYTTHPPITTTNTSTPPITTTDYTTHPPITTTNTSTPPITTTDYTTHPPITTTNTSTPPITPTDYTTHPPITTTNTSTPPITTTDYTTHPPITTTNTSTTHITTTDYTSTPAITTTNTPPTSTTYTTTPPPTSTTYTTPPHPTSTTYTTTPPPTSTTYTTPPHPTSTAYTTPPHPTSTTYTTTPPPTSTTYTTPPHPTSTTYTTTPPPTSTTYTTTPPPTSTTYTTPPHPTSTTYTTTPPPTSTTYTTPPHPTSTTYTTTPPPTSTAYTTHPPITTTNTTTPPPTSTRITYTTPPTTTSTTSTSPPTTTATTAILLTDGTSTPFPFLSTTNATSSPLSTTTLYPPPTNTTSNTTTSRYPPPPTSAPLVCANGGVLLNGVCICPDDWSGKTCTVENFCQAQKLGRFNFPRTPIGWFAYSVEPCRKGTSSAGKPEASTRCSPNKQPPSFEGPLHILECDQTLSDILKNLSSSADLETLAASAQILTSNPEELTTENFASAVEITNSLLLSPNATEGVRVAAVATISQLLNAGTPDAGEESNATLGLTVTLDQLSVNLSLSANSSQSQVVQPNLVVNSVQVPAADTQGVQFTSLSGTSGSFVDDRIQLNTNASEVVVDNGFIADAVMYVGFPAVDPRQEPQNVSLGFVLYQNDRLFRSRRYRRRRATIRVLSATVQGQGRRVTPQHLEMMFRPTLLNSTSLFDFACVFWDYDLQDWSTAGCSKGNASDGLLRCSCNHTTNFAALWSFREDYKYVEALDVISTVGLSFSILGLIVTIIHQVKDNFKVRCWGKKKKKLEMKNSDIALLSICISLLAFIITFVSGVGHLGRQDTPLEVVTQTNTVLDCDEHVEPDRGSCSAVAALLHYFLLATFAWNGLYITVVLVVEMRRSLPLYWTPLMLALGWGVPAVVMTITLGATYSVDNPLGYRQEEFCWLAALDQNKRFDFGKPMFWGFLLPVLLVLVYNVVLLGWILKSIERRPLWIKILNTFSLAMLLGLSWTLGYLVLVTTGTTHLVFSILFCLCNTTQGLQIFVLFTARTPSFRASLSRSAKFVSSANIQLKDRKYTLPRNWRETRSESYRDLMDDM